MFSRKTYRQTHIYCFCNILSRFWPSTTVYRNGYFEHFCFKILIQRFILKVNKCKNYKIPKEERNDVEVKSANIYPVSNWVRLMSCVWCIYTGLNEIVCYSCFYRRNLFINSVGFPCNKTTFILPVTCHCFQMHWNADGAPFNYEADMDNLIKNNAFCMPFTK